jgi:NADPH-dependent ferric siderophore reductase
MVQLLLAEGARTYTPSYDGERITLIVHVHDDTPGATLGKNAKADDPITVFGPRGSLDFTKIKGPAVFFGDETSIGAASVFAQHHGAQPHIVLEASSTSDTAAALAAVQLTARELVQRTDGDGHLHAVAEHIARALKIAPPS